MGSTNSVVSSMNARGEELPESETPWQEFLRLFKKDRLAVMGAYVLGLLLITAFLGKALTEWVVVFDPEIVRLPEKFLPPLSVSLAEKVPVQDQPIGAIYILGTD